MHFCIPTPSDCAGASGKFGVSDITARDEDCDAWVPFDSVGFPRKQRGFNPVLLLVLFSFLMELVISPRAFVGNDMFLNLIQGCDAG